MRSSSHKSIQSFSPSNPGFSTDWRFLIPLESDSNILVITDGQDQLHNALNKTRLNGVTWRVESLLVVGGSSSLDHDPSNSSNTLGINSLFQSFSPGSFSAVVIPFGFSITWSRVQWQTFHRLVHRLIHPGGNLLFGFRNFLYIMGAKTQKMHSFTARQISRDLTSIGYSSVNLFGVMPTLLIPEYVFPFSPPFLSFVLQRRYRRNLPFEILRLIFNPNWVSIFSGLVPYYYAMATV